MYNIITLGYDCSPASVLRSLNLRDFALPFDWVVSNINAIYNCIQDDFKQYHTKLYFNKNHTRLIDVYGFQFPHDYPTVEINNKDSNNIEPFSNQIGEGVIGENSDTVINDDWLIYYDIVKQKYDRRIQRFRDILMDTKPIIVLCRYNTRDILQLYKIFKQKYNRNDIYFVNSCRHLFENDNIINIYTEANGIWNDSSLWKNAIDKTIDKIKIPLTPPIVLGNTRKYKKMGLIKL
jgi:hypothetical protein